METEWRGERRLKFSEIVWTVTVRKSDATTEKTAMKRAEGFICRDVYWERERERQCQKGKKMGISL